VHDGCALGPPAPTVSCAAPAANVARYDVPARREPSLTLAARALIATPREARDWTPDRNPEPGTRTRYPNPEPETDPEDGHGDGDGEPTTDD